MRNRSEYGALLAATLVLAMGCAQSSPAPAPAPAPAAQPGGGRLSIPPQQPPQAVPGAMGDTIASQNDAYVAQITAQIAGKENLPAEQVFKDVQLLKGQSASNLLRIMNTGYSRALGVSCRHCHNPAAWEGSDRREKTEARGMIKMVTMLNEGNKTIAEFGDSPPVISCVVCHKGSRRPSRNVPGQPGAGGQRGGGAAPPPAVRTID